MSKQGHSQEQIDRKLQSIDRWRDSIERYRTQRQELNDNAEIDSRTKRFNPVDVKKMKLISNNIEMCLLNISIIENELLIDKLRKENYKIKTKHLDELTV